MKDLVQKFRSYMDYYEESESGRKRHLLSFTASPGYIDEVNECLRRISDKRLGEESLRIEFRKLFLLLRYERLTIGCCRVMMMDEVNEILRLIQEKVDE